MKIKLFKAVQKGGGDEVILRHMGTTTGDDGEVLQWFSLADDPGGAKWSMSPLQVQQHDWERLYYIGVLPDELGQPKHWFET